MTAPELYHVSAAFLDRRQALNLASKLLQFATQEGAK